MTNGPASTPASLAPNSDVAVFDRKALLEDIARDMAATSKMFLDEMLNPTNTPPIRSAIITKKLSQYLDIIGQPRMPIPYLVKHWIEFGFDKKLFEESNYQVILWKENDQFGLIKVRDLELWLSQTNSPNKDSTTTTTYTPTSKINRNASVDHIEQSRRYREFVSGGPTEEQIKENCARLENAPD